MKIIPTEHALWRKNKDGDLEEVVNQQYTQQQAKRMHDALEEAVGWNWLDDDVPQDINEKCIGLLAELEKQNT